LNFVGWPGKVSYQSIYKKLYVLIYIYIYAKEEQEMEIS
jgi:hypothetical protein